MKYVDYSLELTICIDTTTGTLIILDLDFKLIAMVQDPMWTKGFFRLSQSFFKDGQTSRFVDKDAYSELTKTKEQYEVKK